MGSNLRIEAEQKKRIYKINNFISNNINKNFFYNNNNYFATWSNHEGKIKLQNEILGEKRRFKIFDRLKYFFLRAIDQEQDYEIIEKFLFRKKFTNIVFSYFSSDDVLNSEIYDRFFSQNIFKDQKTLWIVIYQEDNELILKKNYKNIIILKKKKFIQGKIFLIFLFIRYLLSFKKICFSNNKLFNHLEIIFKKVLSNNYIRYFFYLFEAQPVQHYVNKIIREVAPSIKCLPYLHTSLPAFPSEFIIPNFYPKNLICHGIESKKILKKLGWKNTNFIISKSFRYKKKNKTFFKNKIFLPYDFNDEIFIINQIQEIFKNKLLDFFPSLEIQNHPFKKDSIKHLNLIESLKKIMTNKKKANDFCLCIGSTATIVESLENSVPVIHIVEEPIYEVYSKFLWRNFIIKRISNNIYHYKLKKKKSYINFGLKYGFYKFKKKLGKKIVQSP